MSELDELLIERRIMLKYCAAGKTYIPDIIRKLNTDIAYAVDECITPPSINELLNKAIVTLKLRSEVNKLTQELERLRANQAAAKSSAKSSQTKSRKKSA